jgi:hypothetical protein
VLAAPPGVVHKRSTAAPPMYPWPSGASSQPNGRSGLGVLRHPHTTWGYSDGVDVACAASCSMKSRAKLGVGYETFPEDVRTRVVSQFPRVNFKQEIAEAFFHGFEHKPQTTEYTCNEDICSHFIRNYRRRNFYDQVQNSPFQNS